MLLAGLNYHTGQSWTAAQRQRCLNKKEKYAWMYKFRVLTRVSRLGSTGAILKCSKLALSFRNLNDSSWPPQSVSLSSVCMASITSFSSSLPRILLSVLFGCKLTADNRFNKGPDMETSIPKLQLTKDYFFYILRLRIQFFILDE